MIYKIALDNGESIFKLGVGKSSFNLMTGRTGDTHTADPNASRRERRAPSEASFLPNHRAQWFDHFQPGFKFL
jgi:hypothetical protein